MSDEHVPDLEEKRLCHDCVGDSYLSAQVKAGGQISACSYCGKTAPCYDMIEMSNLIEQAFERHYVRTSNEPTSWQYLLLSDNESDYSWERDGEPVVWAIVSAADIPEAAATDIQRILEERHADMEAAQMGEETEFDSDSYYEEKSADDSYWQEEWDNFEWSLKTEARFFSQSAAEHLASIFDGLDEIKTWEGKPLVIDAGPGTSLPALYRARAFQSDKKLKQALARPDLHLGSPPAAEAASGRMNARGISVFYGANSSEVAVAEVRPPVGSQVAVARFEITRRLRLLDLTALGSAAAEGSVFDPDFMRRLERTAFLRSLTQRMTKPVMPDDEAFEYLPTQAVADFLATMLQKPIDGIIYPSVQAAKGSLNIVLFHQAALVAEFDLPKGSEIEVRLGMYSDEGWERDYAVSESVLAPTTKDALTKKDDVAPRWPPNLAELIRTPIPEGPARGGGFRESTLKIDLESIEVRIVKKAEFETENHRVWRHRREKGQ